MVFFWGFFFLFWSFRENREAEKQTTECDTQKRREGLGVRPKQTVCSTNTNAALFPGLDDLKALPDAL